MPHKICLNVEIVLNGNMRISIPVDVKRIGDTETFQREIERMNELDLQMWLTGHMEKDGRPVTASIVITNLSETLKYI